MDRILSFLNKDFDSMTEAERKAIKRSIYSSLFVIAVFLILLLHGCAAHSSDCRVNGISVPCEEIENYHVPENFASEQDRMFNEVDAFIICVKAFGQVAECKNIIKPQGVTQKRRK